MHVYSLIQTMGQESIWEDGAVKEVPISKCEVSQNSGCQQV